MHRPRWYRSTLTHQLPERIASVWAYLSNGTQRKCFLSIQCSAIPMKNTHISPMYSRTPPPPTRTNGVHWTNHIPLCHLPLRGTGVGLGRGRGPNRTYTHWQQPGSRRAGRSQEVFLQNRFFAIARTSKVIHGSCGSFEGTWDTSDRGCSQDVPGHAQEKAAVEHGEESSQGQGFVDQQQPQQLFASNPRFPLRIFLVPPPPPPRPRDLVK